MQAQGRGNGRPQPAPRVVSFEAKPASIKPGETTQLVWSTENPTGLTIEPVSVAVTPRGSRQIKPAATTTLYVEHAGTEQHSDHQHGDGHGRGHHSGERGCLGSAR